MPDIANTFEFDEAQAQQISLKKNQIGFSFQNWSDPDLETLRSSIRRFYRNEQGGKCAYCKQNISLISASNCHIEHIAPKSIHEQFMFESKNMCVICADCNEIKRNQEVLNEVPDTVTSRGNQRVRYPTASNSFKIVHPHLDNYDEHIQVLQGKYYINKTRKGHFTIGACDLNRWIRVFGWEMPAIDEATVSGLMNRFLSNDDFTSKNTALNQLREILLCS
jgi:uncharacterized protein (TIGR02646 family)